VHPLDRHARETKRQHFPRRRPLHAVHNDVRVGKHAAIAVRCGSHLAQLDHLACDELFKRRTRGTCQRHLPSSCRSLNRERHFYIGQAHLASVLEDKAAAVAHLGDPACADAVQRTRSRGALLDLRVDRFRHHASKGRKGVSKR
jgi:hypothetical protein